jgi:hypothetical protein
MLRRELDHDGRKQELNFRIEASHAVTAHFEGTSWNTQPSPNSIEIDGATRRHGLKQASGARHFRTSDRG